jgi:MFS family permease
MTNWKRVLILVSSATVLNMTLLFLLFMNPLSQQIIFSESAGQSPKLVAVWTEISPVPSLVSLLPALTITPLIYSVVFVILYDSIPGRTGTKKGFVFGVILWALIAVFFELFTPSGLFGEPIHLLAYELLLWFIGLTIVGVTMGVIYRKQVTVVTKSI